MSNFVIHGYIQRAKCFYSLVIIKRGFFVPNLINMQITGHDLKMKGPKKCFGIFFDAWKDPDSLAHVKKSFALKLSSQTTFSPFHHIMTCLKKWLHISFMIQTCYRKIDEDMHAYKIQAILRTLIFELKQYELNIWSFDR